MTGIGIGYRDETAEDTHHWRELPDNYIIRRPCVIVLGGSATQTARAANGYLKQVEQMAGIIGVPEQNRPFDMIAPYYKALTEDNRERAVFLLQTEGASPKVQGWYADQSTDNANKLKNWENPPYIQELYMRLFQPLISDKNGTERLPLEQASRNCRRVNIVSHSHGSFVAAKLQDILNKSMRCLGYKQQERDYILSQIKWIDCAGDRIPLGWSKTDTVHFFSWMDEALYQSRHERSFSKMIEKQMRAVMSGKNIALPISKTERIWVTECFKKETDYANKEEHAFDSFVRGAWQAENKSGRAVAFMAAALLQANISDSIRNETLPTPAPKPWLERIGEPVRYRQGPHVVNQHADDKNRINITADRLSVTQKQEMVRTAMQKGEKLPKIPYVINHNAVLRDEAAQQLKKLSRIGKYEFINEFHIKYPYFKRAVR